MKMKIVAAALMPLAACAAPVETGSVTRANPAAEYCAQLGGRSEIRKEEGREVCYCHLPDGRVIDEWELFRASRDASGDTP